MGSRDETTICLFDVDGTLTPARKEISVDMKDALCKLKKQMCVGLVGGSDLVKICEQMGGNSIIGDYDYVFSENGLVGYKNGEKMSSESMVKLLGEEKVQKIINFVLKYMSEITLPAKRGTFIEFRSGMLNVSPIGRSCTYEERLEFNAYDEKHRVRDKFIEALYAQFHNSALEFVVGGQISIDIYPTGWDKRYCLKYMEQANFKTIHFFGDKVEKGGNDYAIYEDSRTIGHKVMNPEDTMQQLQKLFFSEKI